ncbi:hypothetical protein [Burkholderia sola]|uniref:hypothetical protein n=1 Tax=Burkholderia sola TaxID=2843302 RepID=UPI0023DE0C8A|nr:hypothetical protein [Burkholderia sola]MDF3080061.1 hypothetical protein [Burkholderia sola]
MSIDPQASSSGAPLPSCVARSFSCIYQRADMSATVGRPARAVVRKGNDITICPCAAMQQIKPHAGSVMLRT